MTTQIWPSANYRLAPTVDHGTQGLDAFDPRNHIGNYVAWYLEDRNAHSKLYQLRLWLNWQGYMKPPYHSLLLDGSDWKALAAIASSPRNHPPIPRGAEVGGGLSVSKPHEAP